MIPEVIQKPLKPLEKQSNSNPPKTALHCTSQSSNQSETVYHEWEQSSASIARHERQQSLERILMKLSRSDHGEREIVAAYMHHKYRRNCSGHTLQSAYTVIKKFLYYLQQTGGDKKLAEVSPADIESFLEAEQDRGAAIATVRLRLVTLNAFFRFLIEEGIVHESILAKTIRLRMPEVLPRAIEPECLQQLLAVITDTRGRAMVLLLLRSGMRIGELLNTRMQDINLPERKIMIYEARKTGVGRVVYYSDDARRALELWLQQRDVSQPFLFYGRQNHRLSYTAVRNMFMNYVDRAGLADRGYSLHRLRHSFATELLNAGMRLECLQQLLGHTHIEMTRRYARLSDKNREEEYFRAMAVIEQEHINGHH